ncbi:MAG: phosphatidylinositol-specific phospholipase C/glycerophosphodiester phosphodiesterase family protein [Sedimentisphaerales bacterium]|nr:phosphatidylinositol-specific phospholipase C/glycerophosphodiester phosphodiesterase family protein [Sedimentisphaerales bacterium]
MVRIVCVAGLFLLMQAGPSQPRDAVPLLRAHAHNDYLHDPPLLAALEHGFTSVEADVFLAAGQLCVAHDPGKMDPNRTLRSLYLNPLRQRVRANDGRVYRTGSRFFLFVDLKSAAEPTYRKLHETLAEYRDMLTTFGLQGREDRAVLVVVTGNRPLGLMRSQGVRYAACDGRLADPDSDAPADLVLFISDQWTRHFTWRGDGSMPPQERQKLNEIVQEAHTKGRLVRFWATPDWRSAAREAVWRELLSAGVDLLNSDDLNGLQEFLLKHGK